MKRILAAIVATVAVVLAGFLFLRKAEPDRIMQLTLIQTGTVDIDSGLRAPEEGADLWYRAVTSDEKYLEPANGSALAMGRRGNHGDFQPIRIGDLRKGVSLYLKTDEGREAELEVLGFDGNNLKLRVALWGSFLPEDLSARIPVQKERLPMMPERKAFIEANIDEIAANEFPDNTHNRWKVWSTVHDGDFTYVEVKPTPQDVGYPSFVFLLHFAEETRGESIAIYAMEEDNQYALLATDPAWTGKVRDRPL